PVIAMSLRSSLNTGGIVVVLDYTKCHPLVVCAKPPVQLRLVAFRCVKIDVSTKHFYKQSRDCLMYVRRPDCCGDQTARFR
ncbi:MAG TPA: hypothetical protein VJJ82_00645, partial [Candidatus Nanoarchaeia archaeon]|nr:hypothetical protein [Candidatus Nanoarchaeia archaeon]